MMKLKQKHQTILRIIIEEESIQSSGVRDVLVKHGEDISLVTVKRVLSEMTKMGALTVTGSGPATTYSISALGRIYADIDVTAYWIAAI